MRSFSLPERTAAWQPKLQHWATLISSGRANERKKTALLPDFPADYFCGLLRTIESAGALAAETLKLDRTLSDLINAGYGPTSAKIEFLW